VRAKNRWEYYYREYDVPVGTRPIPIFVEPAVRGTSHVLDEAMVRRFMAIVPRWEEWATGLKCIVLDDGDDHCFGWWEEGVIGLSPWYSGMGELWPIEYVEEHAEVLDRLMVPTVAEAGEVRVRFDRKTAAGFLLAHVFLHELGHHYDAMRTKRKVAAPRGERFAEQFGNELAEELWTAFFREFGF